MTTLAVLPSVVGNSRDRQATATPRLPRMTEATLLPEQERRVRIASLIKRAREKAGLTPPQLATKVGRQRSTVNEWERAGGSAPSLVDLGPLCVALKIDPRVFADLPPIPDDPIDEYLLRDPDPELASRVTDVVEHGLTLLPSVESEATQLPKRSKSRRRKPVLGGSDADTGPGPRGPGSQK